MPSSEIARRAIACVDKHTRRRPAITAYLTSTQLQQYAQLLLLSPHHKLIVQVGAKTTVQFNTKPTSQMLSRRAMHTKRAGQPTVALTPRLLCESWRPSSSAAPRRWPDSVATCAHSCARSPARINIDREIHMQQQNNVTVGTPVRSAYRVTAPCVV